MTILVLDCDGVVVTGHAEGGRWDKKLARDLGLDPQLLQARFFQPHWKTIALGEAQMMTVLEHVWPELRCAGTPHAFVDYWFAHDAALDADVLALVDAWRAAGGKAYLGTVQEHNRARHLWETLGLARHFDAIHYSAALGASKPDEAFYARLHARLPAAARSDVIFLDDAQRNVDAANAFGWRARHFRSADDLRAALTASASPRG
ncbi:MAG TPA: HAD-IA family hydrolase [Rhizomicrobium sp.]|nr:HAD-IA family hydrolase [Rhizomicrobium sp.]